MKSVELGKISINDAVEVSNGAIVIVPDGVKKVMDKSRKVVEDAIRNYEIKYGITTGVGALVNTSLKEPELAKFQRNLVFSHSAGTGDMLPQEVVRTAMFLKANELAKGYSGVRFEVVKTLVEMLNKKVHPVVFEKGSLGASGDLVPLAHIALVMIGEGEAFYENKRMSGKDAMETAKIKPLELRAKEALSLINGTQVITAIGALSVEESENLIKISDMCASLCMESLNANLSFVDERIHRLKPHDGQLDCVKNLTTLLKDSGLYVKNSHCRVQDSYSIRCTPQVHGACRDSLYHAKKVVETEINSVTDNPLVFDSDIVSGGNFHGQNIAICLDLLAISFTQIGGISERRINRCLDSSLSGLPPFLAKNNGLNTGMMIAQYTAAHIVSDNKILASPASIDSIPVSANQEDYVSMGMTSATKCMKVLDNLKRILSIELLVGAQAIDMARTKHLGKGTQKVYEVIRKNVDVMDEDRIIYKDIEKVFKMVKNFEIVKYVEDAVGKLK